MGAAIGTEDSTKSRNVELNIIPFIDLMSCLTAFLLVTAVWVNISQLNTKAAGRGRDGIDDPDPDPELSVLVEADEIWVGVSRIEEYERIPKTAEGHDWAKLELSLRAHKTTGLFVENTVIQVAAESTKADPVPYQAMVLAMDVALKVGFSDVKITDPNGLAARPQL